MTATKLFDLPVEVVRAIASRITDSTSRIRFNAVVPAQYRVRKDHDSRLSMLEYIVRSSGRLRLMSADTLRFLLEHDSPLAEPFRGSEHERLMRFEDDVKSGSLGDASSLFPAAATSVFTNASPRSKLTDTKNLLAYVKGIDV